MSKRTILILTYDNPEAGGDDATVQQAVVAAPTKKKALAMLKEEAKDCFRELEESRGSTGEFRLGKYQAFSGKHLVGYKIGRFDIIAEDGNMVCEDSFIVSTAPRLLIM